MKKIQKGFLIATLVVALLQIHGCKKDVDLKHLENLKPCSIDKIISYDRIYRRNDTAVFTYNVHGNPTLIKVTNPGTGNPNYAFRYDTRKRLTHLNAYYHTINGYEQFKIFTYGADGRVAVDTTYIFGFTPDGLNPGTSWGKAINRYTYDALGRITRVDTERILPDPVFSTRTFSYDAAGNLVWPGAVYDDKINFRRTNKLWQFLDQDYSVNNSLIADSYNPVLPLSFRSPDTYRYFLTIDYNDADIYYNCKFPGFVLPAERENKSR